MLKQKSTLWFATTLLATGLAVPLSISAQSSDDAAMRESAVEGAYGSGSKNKSGKHRGSKHSGSKHSGSKQWGAKRGGRSPMRAACSGKMEKRLEHQTEMMFEKIQLEGEQVELYYAITAQAKASHVKIRRACDAMKSADTEIEKRDARRALTRVMLEARLANFDNRNAFYDSLSEAQKTALEGHMHMRGKRGHKGKSGKGHKSKHGGKEYGSGKKKPNKGSGTK